MLLAMATVNLLSFLLQRMTEFISNFKYLSSYQHSGDKQSYVQLSIASDLIKSK